MGKTTHFHYRSADRITDIHAICWEPESEPRGVVQLVHGMQEFIDRYDDFARYLCSLGFVTVGNDHLGHGASVATSEYFGYFAEKNGNKALIADMRSLHRQMAQKYPGLPYFMLGHSMGSFLCRQYLCLYGQELSGAVICGTGFHSAREAELGMGLCRFIAGRKGWMYRSRFMTRLSMGSYNKKFAPARTPQDWLSRDEKVVDAYRADQRTQFMFTLNGFYNLFAGLKYIADPRNLRRMPSDLPVLFIAGEMDPVGDFGAGVKKVYLQFKGRGMEDVECRLYPHDRHEILNEPDKQDVYQDVGNWLQRHERPGR